ncbi:MAG: hypothetical protein RBT62_11415 [Spirochaetia bacterium]|nr:hypothetical protein [Spirochaetia bacterium]
MNYSEFGRVAGVSRAYIRNLTKAGKLPADGAGGVNDRDPAALVFLAAHRAAPAKSARRPQPVPIIDPADLGDEPDPARLPIQPGAAANDAKGFGLSVDEMRRASRYQLFLSDCKRLEAEKRAIEIDRSNGQLLERELVEGLVQIAGKAAAELLSAAPQTALYAADQTGLLGEQRAILENAIIAEFERSARAFKNQILTGMKKMLDSAGTEPAEKE